MVKRQRIIEIFSAGCPACERVIEQIKDAACPSCDIRVLDMNADAVHRRAEQLGIRSVPAVAIDGELADCCSGRGVDMDTLRSQGLGSPIV